jgi:hypothetical protein
MGRWLGLARLFRMPFAAGLALLSGLVWDGIGPQYVFMAFIGLDLAIRVPLLFRMPETLRLRFGKAVTA